MEPFAGIVLSFFSSLLLLAAIAVAGSAAGVWLTGTPQVARRVVPFSGGLLVLIALVFVLPDLAGHFGWAGGMGWMGAGVALLWMVDRYFYPVCPTCSHTHDHDACRTRLHGFAPPLIAAAALHSFLDGWVAVASQGEGGGLGLAVLAGIALHKVPEGLALGVILRAAMNARLAALAWCAAVQSVMLLGGWMESLIASSLSPRWISALLALTGGSFLYLGAHAVHGEWKRRTQTGMSVPLS